ncbi:MAG TPA: hypothetical protein VN131_01595, partial [Mobilitalea sp.]|nr:hypothetical protein [Mobilitalea sp.]
MINKKIIKKATLYILTATIAIQPLTVSAGVNSHDTSSIRTVTTTSKVAVANTSYSKDEVVYSTLSASGDVKGIYVVNTFDIKEAGRIKDMGDYSSVVNLTNENEIAKTGNTIEFDAPKGKFYYQGNMDTKELPWIFNIAYTLDGKIISPEDLAGKSGQLEINIRTNSNPNSNTTFYQYYMLQVTLTLASEKCENINAPGAVIANAGSNKQINFTVLPGKEGNLSFKSDVTDFEMEGISIAAVPFNMSFDMPDTANMTDDLAKLPDAIKQLDDGILQLKDGVNQLASGAGDLKAGSSQYKGVISKLDESSGSLLSASSSIKGALGTISSSLKKNFGTMDISRLSSLPASLTQLSGGLKELSNSLNALQSGYSEAYTALDNAMAGLSASTLTTEELAKISQNQDNEIILKLLQSYRAAMTVKGTYDSVKDAFEAVNTNLVRIKGTIDTISAGLDTMASELNKSLDGFNVSDQLQALLGGMNELYTNYSQFHTGLTAYMNGVSTLNKSYTDINSGITSLSDGVVGLSNGVSGLSDGTDELYTQTKDMPDKIQNEIEKISAEYDASGFVPISFTDPENNAVNLVQF